VALSAILPVVQPTIAQGPAPAAPTLTKDTVSTVTQKNEVPRIALSPTQMHVTWKSGSPNKSRTGYNQRPEASGSWPAQQTMGGNSNGSYHTSSVAVSPVDSSVHLIWVDTSQGGDGFVFYSRQQGNGAWTTPLRISSVGRFAHFPHLAVDTTGHIWAVWSAENPAGNDVVFYRYSTDNGASWQPGSDGVIDDQNAKVPWITADKSGGVHVVWWRKVGGVWYARWTGSDWAKEGIPSGGFNANPSVTVDPSNNLHVAWRRQRDFAQWDIYYATRPVSGGSWSIAKLYEGGNIDKTIPIYADETGTLYVAWYDTVSGSEIWYTTKSPGGSWLSPPINVSNDGLFNTNPDVVGRGGTRGHVVFETWFGGDADVRIQHVQVGSAPVGCGGTLVLEGGKGATNNPTVAGVITPVNCTPDQMQVSVDAPPTGATPKVTYSSNMSVSIPASSACVHTVYVQLYVNGVGGQVMQASIKVDTSVNANVQSLNPHMADLPTTYTPPVINDTSDQNGASDGDPNYTRDHAFFINVADTGDCVGLDGFDAKGSISSKVTNGTFTNVIPLPGDFSIGPKTFDVVVSDTLDNVGTFPTAATMFKLTYDPADTDPSSGVTNTVGLPVLAANGSVVGDSATNSIIRTLSFSAISVSDNLYGQQGEGLVSGKQFWGVWVANSRQDNAENSTALKWFPVHIATPGPAFSIQWSIFSGLDYGADPTKDGTYYVYVRFLDGAGNPSAGFLKTTLTLDPGYALPTVNLPLISR
jgi:hypothetical protein